MISCASPAPPSARRHRGAGAAAELRHRQQALSLRRGRASCARPARQRPHAHLLALGHRQRRAVRSPPARAAPPTSAASWCARATYSPSGGLFASYSGLERQARDAKAGIWAAGECRSPRRVPRQGVGGGQAARPRRLPDQGPRHRRGTRLRAALVARLRPRPHPEGARRALVLLRARGRSRRLQAGDPGVSTKLRTWATGSVRYC